MAYARTGVSSSGLYFHCSHKFLQVKIFHISLYFFSPQKKIMDLFYLELNIVVFSWCTSFLNTYHHFIISQHNSTCSSYHFILQNVQNADFGRSLISLFPMVQNFVCVWKLFQVFIQISLYTYQYFSQASWLSHRD